MKRTNGIIAHAKLEEVTVSSLNSFISKYHHHLSTKSNKKNGIYGFQRLEILVPSFNKGGN